LRPLTWLPQPRLQHPPLSTPSISAQGLPPYLRSSPAFSTVQASVTWYRPRRSLYHYGGDVSALVYFGFSPVWPFAMLQLFTMISLRLRGVLEYIIHPPYYANPSLSFYMHLVKYYCVSIKYYVLGELW
jgi:hypothetical protein